MDGSLVVFFELFSIAVMWSCRGEQKYRQNGRGGNRGNGGRTKYLEGLSSLFVQSGREMWTILCGQSGLSTR
ncbi:MAG: hypothetical protein EA409_13440 [Saprospirales bacterium]|nr:MAG: hypothetical protein EA409_13440 [Saprospirales bacterium]